MNHRERLNLFGLRLRKGGFALTHPVCWRGLRLGVLPTADHAAMLRAVDPDLVLDVGANRGQFALACASLHPGVPIVSFEPIPAEAGTCRKAMAGHRKHRLIETALGARAGQAELHLSASADSSSLLPIGELQTRLFPSTREVGTLWVQVARLDDLEEVWSGASRALLKLDVQGFELAVLEGATRALGHCGYVYCECSEVELYKGQALVGEVEGFLARQGFAVARRMNEVRDGERLVQADYLFTRRKVGEMC